jgi:hypothetical protein
LLPSAKNPEPLSRGYGTLIQLIRSDYDGSVVLTVSDLMDQSPFSRLAREMNLPLIGLRAPVQQVVDILGNARRALWWTVNPGSFALRGGTPVDLLAGKTAKMDASAGMVRLGPRPSRIPETYSQMSSNWWGSFWTASGAVRP